MFISGQMVIIIKRLIELSFKNYVNYGCGKKYKTNILILTNTFLKIYAQRKVETIESCNII